MMTLTDDSSDANDLTGVMHAHGPGASVAWAMERADMGPGVAIETDDVAQAALLNASLQRGAATPSFPALPPLLLPVRRGPSAEATWFVSPLGPEEDRAAEPGGSHPGGGGAPGLSLLEAGAPLAALASRLIARADGRAARSPRGASPAGLERGGGGSGAASPRASGAHTPLTPSRLGPAGGPPAPMALEARGAPPPVAQPPLPPPSAAAAAAGAVSPSGPQAAPWFHSPLPLAATGSAPGLIALRPGQPPVPSALGPLRGQAGAAAVTHPSAAGRDASDAHLDVLKAALPRLLVAPLGRLIGTRRRRSNEGALAPVQLPGMPPPEANIPTPQTRKRSASGAKGLNVFAPGGHASGWDAYDSSGGPRGGARLARGGAHGGRRGPHGHVVTPASSAEEENAGGGVGDGPRRQGVSPGGSSEGTEGDGPQPVSPLAAGGVRLRQRRAAFSAPAGDPAIYREASAVCAASAAASALTCGVSSDFLAATLASAPLLNAINTRGTGFAPGSSAVGFGTAAAMADASGLPAGIGAAGVACAECVAEGEEHHDFFDSGDAAGAAKGGPADSDSPCGHLRRLRSIGSATTSSSFGSQLALAAFQAGDSFRDGMGSFLSVGSPAGAGSFFALGPGSFSSGAGPAPSEASRRRSMGVWPPNADGSSPGKHEGSRPRASRSFTGPHGRGAGGERGLQGGSPLGMAAGLGGLGAPAPPQLQQQGPPAGLAGGELRAFGAPLGSAGVDEMDEEMGAAAAVGGAPGGAFGGAAFAPGRSA